MRENVLQQLLSHAAKSDVVEESVVGHKPNDARAGRFDQPVSQTQELDVVVLQPVLFFPQRLAVHLEVVGHLRRSSGRTTAQQLTDPRIVVVRHAREGRVSQHDGVRMHFVDQTGLADPRLRQRVAQMQLEFARSPEVESGLDQPRGHQEVCQHDCRQHQFLSAQPRKHDAGDEFAPRIRRVCRVVRGPPVPDVIERGQQEHAGAHGRVQHAHKRRSGVTDRGHVRGAGCLPDIEPRRAVGPAVPECQLGAQHLVDAAYHIAPPAPEVCSTHPDGVATGRSTARETLRRSRSNRDERGGRHRAVRPPIWPGRSAR